MGCNCGKSAAKKIMAVGSNIVKAAASQPDIIQWFKDGVSGIVKCIGGISIYTDEQIQHNRNICRGCIHSTKTDGKLTAQSQCMAPDPLKNGAACGCIILCKTQTDKCPLGKWASLTVNGDSLGV